MAGHNGGEADTAIGADDFVGKDSRRGASRPPTNTIPAAAVINERIAIMGKLSMDVRPPLSHVFDREGVRADDVAGAWIG